MEQYTVGSLAGLISGKTPKKKHRVVAKEFQMPTVKVEQDDNFQVMKVKKEKAGSVIKDVKSEPDTPKKKKSKSPKKRKSEPSQPDLLDSDHEEPNSPKKQKLSQNDENAIKRVKKKKRLEKQESPEYNDRTIFVGNIPIHTKKIKIKKFFQRYGDIESLRIRGIPVKDPKTPKKVAAIKKEFHPDRNTVFAYVRFAHEESAKQAEFENGVLFEGHHIRVQTCGSKGQYDESKAIFIGNLPFCAEEEDLWGIFQDCGEISHIRIVRDGRTGIGKGFGYVNFKDNDGVQLALEMTGAKLKDRELRISLCDIKRAKKKDKVKKPRHRNLKKTQQTEEHEENGENSYKKDGQKRFMLKKKKNTNGDVENRTAVPQTNFGGTKFDENKKKKKFSKDLAQKKKLAKKLAPKPSA